MSNHGNAREPNRATAARTVAPAPKATGRPAPTSREGRHQAERATHAAFTAAREKVAALARSDHSVNETDRLHAHAAALQAAMRAGWEHERAALLANPFGAQRAAARAWQGALANLDHATRLDQRVERIEAPTMRDRARISALHGQQTNAFYDQRAGKITQAQYDAIIARTTRQLTPIRTHLDAQYADHTIGERSSALAHQAQTLRTQADHAMQEQLGNHDAGFRALRAGQVIELHNTAGQRHYLIALPAGVGRQGLEEARFSVYSPHKLTYGVDSRQKAETFLTPGSRNFQSGDENMRLPLAAWPYLRASLLDAGYTPSGQTYPTLIAARTSVLKARQAEIRAEARAAKRAQAGAAGTAGTAGTTGGAA